jgi:hypothetical protein
MLGREDGTKLRPVRGHLRSGQRGVEVRLREFLDTKPKQEMIRGEHANDVLADRGFAAAGRPRDEHNLSILSASSTFCTSAARSR